MFLITDRAEGEHATSLFTGGVGLRLDELVDIHEDFTRNIHEGNLFSRASSAFGMAVLFFAQGYKMQGTHFPEYHAAKDILEQRKNKNLSKTNI